MADKRLPTKEAQAETAPNDANEIQDQERREAVKKLGKYAAYTAPALPALMTKTKSAAKQ